MAIPAKALLAYHLDHTFEKEAMQPSLAAAVRGLTAEQAAWKSSPQRHSIWQITRHVAHWKEGVIAALEGRPVEYDAWNRRDWAEVEGSQAEWEADVARLHAVSREIRTRLEDFDDMDLAREVRWYAGSRSTRPVAIRLLQMATHDTYHAGQIQYVFALQEIPVEELAAAASRDDVLRAQSLLASMPDAVYRFTRDGWTALHVACYFGMTEAAQFLLSCGASPNAVSRNAEAETPLHSTVGGIGNRSEIVSFLQAAGADPSLPEASGKTPADLARAAGEDDLAALLDKNRDSSH